MTQLEGQRLGLQKTSDRLGSETLQTKMAVWGYPNDHVSHVSSWHGFLCQADFVEI